MHNSSEYRNVSSRAFKEACERKAKKVYFYQNGKPFASKLTVSIIPGKDFQNFNQLCQYLTDKTQLLNGVKYIFTTNGMRVLTLNELEHDQSYVMSGSKNFVPHHYGTNKVNHVTFNPQDLVCTYKVDSEEDLRPARPLSSKYNSVYANADHLSPLVQQCKDSRIITVVNNQRHDISSRVVLNLKCPKPFNVMLQDLGRTVRLTHPRRMFTSSGFEVCNEQKE